MADIKSEMNNLEDVLQKSQSQNNFQVTNLCLDETPMQNDETAERNEQNEKKFQDYLNQQGNQEVTREQLLAQFSEDDRQYMIVDLSNSCVYDSRKDEDINKLNSSNSTSASSTKSRKSSQHQWQEFWQYYNHIK